MKPSLHELIVNVIETYLYENRNIDITIEESDELAEQIIKIIRDYHLVESDNSYPDWDRTVADDLETIRDGGE